MSSPDTGLVTTTPQASLVLLDARPDPAIGVPSSNTTTLVRDLLHAGLAGSVLLWDSDAEQFHLYTSQGAFIFRRNEMTWPDGTTLRGEDVAALLAAQDCTPVLPTTAFAGRFSGGAVTLTTMLTQALPGAPPGTVAVLATRHGSGVVALETDGQQLHLRTTEGWFSFRGNCVTFPHGQTVCGEELCPPPLPLVVGAAGLSWRGAATAGAFVAGSWAGAASTGVFSSGSWSGAAD